MSEILTFSNAGTKLLEIAEYIKTTGRIPSPEICGLDNENRSAYDNLTNYAWAIREACKLTDPENTAVEGKPIRGTYKGMPGVWNQFGEFTAD